jgi:protein-disulfide isomerase
VPVLEQVLEKYPHEVKCVFKHFPLNNHKFARHAAAAALSAGRQGKFWEFHDKLFENYDQLNQQKIQTISQDLGLDTAKFAENIKDFRILAAVDRDISDGDSAGVRGTPTVFVNGKLLRNMNFRDFQFKIEKELQKIREGGNP